MIKIENPNLTTIAQDYFDRIKVTCITRSKFYSLILRVLNGENHALLENDTTHGGTRKSLANKILIRGRKVRNLRAFDRVNNANVYRWVANNISLLTTINNYLQNEQNLKSIILCDTASCYTLTDRLKAHLGITNQNSVAAFKFINTILDYSIFYNHSYWLGSKLGINTCPYCNRVPIHTIYDKGREVLTSTYDHFYPQKFHQFLALSFYNLIPSCYYCNSNLKTATGINPTSHLHPHLDGFSPEIKFGVQIFANKPNKSDPENYNIFLRDALPRIAGSDAKFIKIDGNKKLFELEAIYQVHRDWVGEIIVKCDTYSSAQANSLQSFYQLLGSNKAEFYQYYFANYINEKDFNRRPLAKLTRDIIEQELPHF